MPFCLYFLKKLKAFKFKFYSFFFFCHICVIILLVQLAWRGWKQTQLTVVTSTADRGHKQSWLTGSCRGYAGAAAGLQLALAFMWQTAEGVSPSRTREILSCTLELDLLLLIWDFCTFASVAW